MKLALLLILFLSLVPSQQVASFTPLQAVEQSIIRLDHEVAVVFRGTHEVARFEGDRTSTTVIISWRWINGTLTHNHPCPALPSISIPDLVSAIAGNLREIRAVSTCMGYPIVCRAWRIGSRWRRLSNIPLLRAQVQTLIDYKPWPEQEMALRSYITGLAHQYGFGYECVPWK